MTGRPYVRIIPNMPTDDLPALVCPASETPLYAENYWPIGLLKNLSRFPHVIVYTGSHAVHKRPHNAPRPYSRQDRNSRVVDGPPLTTPTGVRQTALNSRHGELMSSLLGVVLSL